MIDGMVERIEAELGESTSVVASGKDADTVTALCKHDIIRDDTLILLGLAKIYDKNSRKKKQK